MCATAASLIEDVLPGALVDMIHLPPSAPS